MASRSSGLIGSGIGAAVGGYFGGPAGAQAGASAGYQIGDIFGARAREKYDVNRQFEAEVRNYLFTKNLIDYQNEYNSPKNQMKRLQEAGLNPMLVYGGGNVTGNQSAGGSAPSTAPTLSKRQSRAFDIAMYQDIENKGLNNELLHQRILAEHNSNRAFDTNQALAVANATENNRILQAKYRYEKAMADIAEHDRNISVSRSKTTSKDNSLLAFFDSFSNANNGKWQKRLYDVNHNPDGSEKPWYQFWDQDSIFGRWHKRNYGW